MSGIQIHNFSGDKHLQLEQVLAKIAELQKQIPIF
jgi:hypothetical protein